MAAVIPFTTIEGVIAALAKIDVMHKHMATTTEGKVSDEYFLAPMQVHVVSQGDDLLWDGASKFVNSDTLRFRVGDSVKCLVADIWVGGVVVRQPVQDGEAAAYDILLADGRRVMLNEDSDSYVRAGDPRAVSSFELIFAGSKVRKPHDDALANMGQFGRDVQLVDNLGPPEVVGRMVASLKTQGAAPTAVLALEDGLYERTLEAAAGLIGAAVPANWQEQRAAIVAEHWPPQKKRQRGRPPAGGPKDPAFFCPVEGCDKAYASYGGLYLHKRSHHPELIPKSEEEERERKRTKKDKAPPAKPETAYQYFCKEARPAIKEAGAAGDDVGKVLQEKWEAVTAEEKAKYEEMSVGDKARYEKECASSGFDPETGEKVPGGGSKRKQSLGEDGLPLPKALKPPKAAKVPRPKKKKDLSDEEPDDEDEDQEPVELLPWAVPDGFAVSTKPDEAQLEPRNPEGKKLVGRSVLYHWADVGWCSGVIEKANGDKSKTVDGDMVNFEIYYEMDDDLSRHVLEMEKYLPDGPANSWVLLETAEVVVAAEIVAADAPPIVAADAVAAEVTPAEEVEVQVTIDA
mmetsp:Transcript_80615/g.195442  ORF Transcript_80615/g.195442 Transcript_80615/m.195442 type:complete len:573 (+) Transcript_80615:120-1838(+)